MGINFSQAQPIDSAGFEARYNKILQVLAHTQDSIEQLLYVLDQEYELEDIQKARLNLIRIENHDLYNPDRVNFALEEPETLSSKDLPMLDKARIYLEQGRPSMAIPLIVGYLETVDMDSDSADFARITLAEGYRSVEEFQKGIDLTYKILSKPNLSPYNRAYGYNRLAALYAESSGKIFRHKTDSTIKYSKLCVALSEKHNYPDHLAASQNELGYYYYKFREEFNIALDYLIKAKKNYLIAGKTNHANRTINTVANVYLDMGEYNKALTLINNTLKDIDVNKNRTSSLIFYLNLATIHKELGNKDDAYEYLRTARRLQVYLHKKNIRAQIYDLAAQYEAEKKENENNELRMANKIKELELNDKNELIRFLFIMLVLIGISLAIIFYQLSQKRKAYNNLVKANLDIVKAEQDYSSVSDKNSDSNNTNKSANNSSTNDELTQLLENLNTYMNNEKPYLDSTISLEDISQKLETNRTYLSKLINEHFNKNFKDYINEYRVKTARHILADPSMNHISIEGVGQMSGFNSRSNFFTCFKKDSGISPSYFRQMIK